MVLRNILNDMGEIASSVSVVTELIWIRISSLQVNI